MRRGMAARRTPTRPTCRLHPVALLFSHSPWIPHGKTASFIESRMKASDQGTKLGITDDSFEAILRLL
jgi:hypothetical protein